MLNPDFREFLQSLNANGVRYLVVGGYAVAYYGHPRYTKDLDVWVEMSPRNAEGICAALEQFGFGSLDLSPADFLQANQVIQLGYPPARIDILMQADGVSFAECYAARVPVDLDGLTVTFIDLESLKANKRASGRLQDLADLEQLG